MDSTYTASNNGVWVCIKGITTGLYSLEVSLKTQQEQLTELPLTQPHTIV